MRDSGFRHRATTSPTDRRLLALLLANARQSTQSLARQLNVNRTTVHKRLRYLEASGLIVGYTALVAPPAGEFTKSILLVRLAQRDERRILDQINRIHAVKLCLKLSGNYDFILTVETPDVQRAQEVCDRIRQIRGIDSAAFELVTATQFDRRSGVARLRPKSHPKLLTARSG